MRGRQSGLRECSNYGTGSAEGQGILLGWRRSWRVISGKVWHSDADISAQADCAFSIFYYLIPVMLQQLLSITQAAERLRVRPTYVRELVTKGRLSFVHGEQLDAAEVDQLAKLMNKLRHEGLATLVQINSDENKP